MKIGIDLDGVLYNWDAEARALLNERYGDVSPNTSTSWYGLRSEVTKSAWNWLWSPEGQALAFGNLASVYEDMVDTAAALMEADHEVHFVTHRDPRNAAVPTAQLLQHHFWRHRWAGLHLIRSTTQKCDLSRFDVFVDDRPETIYGFMDRRPGTKLFAPSRPWNTELAEDMDDDDRVEVYTDAADVYHWVEGQTRGSHD